MKRGFGNGAKAWRPNKFRIEITAANERPRKKAEVPRQEHR